MIVAVSPGPHRRQYPSQPLAGVGVVVLWQDRVLLVERRRPPLAGHWSVPGGLIELGEEARAAAARELREETGLEADIGAVVTTVDRIEHDPDGRVLYHFVITDFLALPRDAPAAHPPALHPATDASAARWVAWDELDSLPLSPGLIPVLRLARERARQQRQHEAR